MNVVLLLGLPKGSCVWVSLLQKFVPFTFCAYVFKQFIAPNFINYARHWQTIYFTTTAPTKFQAASLESQQASFQTLKMIHKCALKDKILFASSFVDSILSVHVCQFDPPLSATLLFTNLIYLKLSKSLGCTFFNTAFQEI